MLVYLLIVNAIAFTLMLLDKCFAKKRMQRIPESTLMLAAILGGSLGVISGMYACRHKTRQSKFKYGLPILLVIQITLLLLLH